LSLTTVTFVIDVDKLNDLLADAFILACKAFFFKMLVVGVLFNFCIKTAVDSDVAAAISLKLLIVLEAAVGVETTDGIGDAMSKSVLCIGSITGSITL
jgi:hypothetical protein